MTKRTVILLLVFLFTTIFCGAALPDSERSISGQMQKWHPVTIAFTGPQSSETAETNPFLDFRLDVTFKKGKKTIIVPGYFAADGNAAETGAVSGNQWRVHFMPDEEGVWN